MTDQMKMWLDLLAFAALVLGMGFMLLTALGMWRLPDLYHRMHAANIGVTLGITSLLIAALFNLCTLEEASTINIITKVLLLIIFQFGANPVGAHLLSKAAHADRCPMWKGTLGDELEDDTAR
jgi:multicomponent Na+:H+ antiporter subunit G